MYSIEKSKKEKNKYREYKKSGEIPSDSSDEEIEIEINKKINIRYLKKLKNNFLKIKKI